MKLLSYPEFMATLSMWRSEERPILGFFMTMGQIVIGGAVISETPGGTPMISIDRVVKEVSWSGESPKRSVEIPEGRLLAAWHSTTFDPPPNASLIADHFDEQLQLTVRGDLPTVALYRASAFKAARANSNVG